MAKSILIASPSRPQSEASWSSRPVSAPTQSFSTREQSFASSTRSGSGAPATASSASESAASSAAEEESPEPARDVAAERDPRALQRDAGRAQLGHGAADERAPAVRAAGIRGGEAVVLAEVARLGDDLPVVARLRLGGDAAVDRERQRQAPVVVRVLADQVDAAGTEGAEHGAQPRRFAG